ncbi:SpoIIE family protein phosphatase [candidate division CSSED10-310 bacterium]|uniref:SpoIIE family protein phosphatase n=1 Tax=candidate division CSSED10-310 bacterium TaxID=2855610 RepID=A0ABV6Z336_UNCC1
MNDLQTTLKYYQKLAFRFIIIIVIILVTLVILLNLFSIYRQTEILTHNLESKARTITEIVALTCSNAIIGGDFTFLGESLKAVAKDPDVAYGLIVDRDNYVLVHTNPAEEQKKLSGGIHEQAVQSNTIELVPYYDKELKTEIIDASFPIILRSGEKWGVIRFGFSKNRLTRSIYDAYQLAGLTAIIFIFVGIFIAVILSKNITRPVEILVNQATLVTQGELDEKIEVATKDEIGILAGAFDEMRVSLKNKITQLARKIDELSTLHDVGMAITATLEVEVLIQRILHATTDTLRFSRALLFLVDSEKNILTNGVGMGITAEQTQVISALEFPLNEDGGLISEIMKTGKPVIFYKSSGRGAEEKKFLSLFDINTIALVPLRAKEKSIGLYCVDKSEQKQKIAEDDLLLLSIFASQAAIAIENAQLYEATAQKERMEMELQTAKTIQMALLPQKPPRIKGLDLAGICIPASEVGGDYYDFLELPNNILGLVIGDVNGHGVPAGLIMAVAKSSLRTQIRNDHNPETVLPILNNVLFDAAQRKLLMTFFYSVFDLSTRTLTYSNAGQNFPYLYQAQTGTLSELLLGGPPLGFKKNRQYKEKQIKLYKDDVLILYSDGIVEAENPLREMYDYDRFEDVIKTNAQKSALDIQNLLLDNLGDFCNGQPPDDDITMIVMKVQY